MQGVIHPLTSAASHNPPSPETFQNTSVDVLRLMLSFLEKAKTNATVWIRELEGTPKHFEVYVPNGTEGPDAIKKTYDVALSILNTYGFNPPPNTSYFLYRVSIYPSHLFMEH